MFGNQIAENFLWLADRFFAARKPSREDDFKHDDRISALSGDIVSDDTQPTPYLPDYHDERNQSSLHLSC